MEEINNAILETWLRGPEVAQKAARSACLRAWEDGHERWTQRWTNDMDGPGKMALRWQDPESPRAGEQGCSSKKTNIERRLDQQ